MSENEKKDEPKDVLVQVILHLMQKNDMLIEKICGITDRYNAVFMESMREISIILTKAVEAEKEKKKKWGPNMSTF